MTDTERGGWKGWRRPSPSNEDRLREIVREEIEDAKRKERQRKQDESDDFWDIGVL